MRIGIIGLGDIAQKAYLPVIGVRPDIELYIATRNAEVLAYVGSAYRIPPNRRFETLDGLLTANPDAVFVHTSTEAHFAVVERLLLSGIHVYVDKPVDYHLANTERLIALAKAQERLLMVGFNRRFAPLYQQVKAAVKPEIVLMQKNRVQRPENPRTFILDDFIHVVDTLLHFSPGEMGGLAVRYQMQANQLTNVVIQLSNAKCTAIGMMNRNSGTNEEVLEVMGEGQKFRVTDLRQLTTYKNGEHQTKFGDWTSVGVVRGFTAIVDVFHTAVRDWTASAHIDLPSVQATHAVCEEIVRQIEAQPLEEKYGAR